MIRTAAVLVLLVGAILFGIEAVRGDIRGQGMKLIAIVSSVAAIFLISQHSIRKKLLSGMLMDDHEGLSFDTRFIDFDTRVNGVARGIVTAPECGAGVSKTSFAGSGGPKENKSFYVGQNGTNL